MKDFGNVDSKYRFVIIASKRAKELLKGAKSRLKSKSRNPIRIAQSEVKLGLVEFEIIPTKPEELPEVEERVFLGGGAGGEFEEGPAEPVSEEPKTGAGAPGAAGDLGVDFSDEFEPLSGEDEERGEGAEEVEGADEEAEGEGEEESSEEEGEEG